jgi:DNA polymerase-3 subunit beta
LEFTVVQEELKVALDAVKRASSTKLIFAQLGNVLVSAGDGLSLRCTDLDLYIDKKIPAQVKEEGQASIPVAVLSEFISSLPNDKVTIKSKEGSVSVKCGRFSANLKTLPVDDFPVPGVVEGSVEVDGDAFASAAGSVIHAVAQDDSRPVLSGLFFSGEHVIGADGFRVARASFPYSGKPMIVPLRAAKEMLRAATGTIQIGANDNLAVLKTETMELGCRLISGGFPDVDRVLPKGGSATVTVSVAELTNTIRAISVFDKIKVKMEIGETFILSGQEAEVGDNTATCPAEITGPGLTIAASPKFLMDLLGAVGAEKIMFVLEKPTTPILIKVPSNDQYVAVIMPLNLNRNV